MKVTLVMKVCRFCKQILSMRLIRLCSDAIFNIDFKTFVTRVTFITPSPTLGPRLISKASGHFPVQAYKNIDHSQLPNQKRHGIRGIEIRPQKTQVGGLNTTSITSNRCF
jgi:hypothetical protein